MTQEQIAAALGLPVTEDDFRQKAYKPQNEDQVRQWRVVAAHHRDMGAAEILRWLVSREANRIEDGNTRQAALVELVKVQADQAEEVRNLQTKLDASLMLIYAIAESMGIERMRLPKEAVVEALAQARRDEVFIRP